MSSSTNYQQKMKAYRAANNLSQEEMAFKLGYSQQNYSNVERGRSKITTEFLELWKDKTGNDLTESGAPTSEIGILKYHYESLLKFVMSQSDKVKDMEDELRRVRDELKETKKHKATH